jgi:hypothetical protein
LNKQGYSHETNILDLLPRLNPIQQVKIDIALNMNGIDAFPGHSNLLVSDSQWKQKLIPVFQGKEKNPQVIQTLIGVVKNAIQSHKNRASNQLTGSAAWNQTWIHVYNQWLKKLHNLGEFNEA